ncbi:hypothetical protein HD806DRAFT_412031 [Xylariaceae sp. AK1471]|nr:hypothetical protein HD806DRAFT_412031 [Xylariaceae sp. AK1471]
MLGGYILFLTALSVDYLRLFKLRRAFALPVRVVVMGLLPPHFARHLPSTNFSILASTHRHINSSTLLQHNLLYYEEQCRIFENLDVVIAYHGDLRLCRESGKRRDTVEADTSTLFPRQIMQIPNVELQFSSCQYKYV